MGKLTLEQLRKLREEKRKEIRGRESDGKTTQIIVGMGTCGIAAGAKAAYDAIVQEVAAHHLDATVMLRQTGCMGLCTVEPTVEVSAPGMPTVIYGTIDAEAAKEIVRSHVVGKALLDNHIFDRPAVDIVKQ